MSAFTELNELNKQIRVIKQKRSKNILLRGFLKSSAIVLFIISAVLLFSHLYPNSYYYSVITLLGLAAVVFALTKYLIYPYISSRNDIAVINDLANVKPELREDTLNALLLGNELEDSPKYELGSESLIKAHILKATDILKNIDLGKLYPLGRLKPYPIALALACFILFFALITAPDPFLNYVKNGGFFNMADNNIELADIQITYIYPEHTSLAKRTIEGSNGDVETIKGTKVVFSANPLQRLKSGQLVIQNGPVVPVEYNNGSISAEFIALENSTYFIQDNIKNTKSPDFKIKVNDDTHPSIKITRPESNLKDINTDEKLEIAYEATDDSGLERIMIAYETESGKSSKLIKEFEQAPKSYKGKYYWDLRSHDDGRGANIRVWLEGYDNDKVDGPKKGVSNTLNIKLKNLDETHSKSLTSIEQVRERLIDALATELTNSRLIPDVTNPDQESSSHSLSPVEIESELDTQIQVKEQVRLSIDSLATAINHMREDNYSDYIHFVGLANMQKRLAELQENREALVVSFNRTQLPALRSFIEFEIGELEDHILYLDAILEGERLRESLRHSKQILEEASGLKDLMKQLSNTNDPKIKAQIEQELNQLRNALSELTRKLSSLQNGVHSGHVNQDALQGMNLEDKLNELNKLIQEGNTEQAMKMLSEMLNNLRQMVASLETGLRSHGTSSLSAQISELNNLQEDIDSLKRAETGLKDDTTEFKKELSTKSSSSTESYDELTDNMRDNLARLKNQLTQAKEKTSRLKREENELDSGIIIDRARQNAQDLGNWIDSGDFGESIRNAKSLEQKTRVLKSISEMNPKNTDNAKQELAESHRLAKEIRQELENLKDTEPTDAMSHNFANRQDRITNETSELNKKIEDNKLPLTPEISKNIEQAQKYMQQASNGLRNKEISKAISNQDEAIKSLEQAQNQTKDLMKNMMQSANGNGSPVPMVFGQSQQSGGITGVDRRHVEIPVLDESMVGKEFKDNILEAMLLGSPEGYNELNKKYYDRILK